MKKNFSKAAFLLGIALSVSGVALAQESKVKVEAPGYELKVKQDGDEFKYKEEGTRPMERSNMAQRQTITVREGRTMTTVKPGKLPEAKKTAAKTSSSRSYAAKKKCNCPTKSTAARKPAAKKSTATAYKAKPKTGSSVARTPARPTVVRDTVFITRVDTLVSMIEPAYHAGYSSDKAMLRDNFKKLKIERDKNGEITLKKEYADGREIKREFESEEEFNTYMDWKNF